MCIITQNVKCSSSAVPDKNAEPEKNEKPENEADGNSAGEDETDSLLPENKKAEISKTGVGMPLTTRHRRNSISLPAGLNNLDIQVKFHFLIT